MSSSSCNEKGVSLIEALIALVLLTLGILGLLSLQPSAWRLSGKSDYLGRAAGILQSELADWEMRLMNPNFPNPCQVLNKSYLFPSRVRASGQSSDQEGDATFTVETTVSNIVNNPPNSVWTVAVQVTWLGNSAPLRESIVVKQQDSFQ